MTIYSTSDQPVAAVQPTPREEFPCSAVVQLLHAERPDGIARVVDLHDAVVTVDSNGVAAVEGECSWTWMVADITAVVHGAGDSWTLIDVDGAEGFGVRVPPHRAEQFRAMIDRLVQRAGGRVTAAPVDRSGPHLAAVPATGSQEPVQGDGDAVTSPSEHNGSDVVDALSVESLEISDSLSRYLASLDDVGAVARSGSAAIEATSSRAEASPTGEPQAPVIEVAEGPIGDAGLTQPTALAGIDARDISAWFGSHMVLDRVSLNMPAGQVTALIGPSGCGKSTFLRILNRMHEMIPSAAMAGEVIVDGHDLYDASRKLIDARRDVGMVFQKPNPFPAMSIYDNVLASYRLTGVKATAAEKDAVVESCLNRAGLWNEVRDRLRKPGGGLSGGQQQRLCIARALAIRPRVLLMDEPCSALDPTSTRRIEETILDLVSELTIVIVTHNMQQAARVSNQCAFFLAEHGKPGVIVEYGPTSVMFSTPRDPRTNDYVNGRFG